jgi:ABC-type sugar transport system permease subunit
MSIGESRGGLPPDALVEEEGAILEDCIRVIDAFKLFDIIFIVTQRGGPGTATQTLGMLTYNTGFIAFQISKAAALGVLLVLIVSPIYFLWRRSQRSVT